MDKCLNLCENVVENGLVLTFEKDQSCTLVQLCDKPINHGASDIRIIAREWRKGKQRKNLETLRQIIIDPQPLDKTVQNILEWCVEELREKYHIADSNCQHFSSNLWNNFSSQLYPNPSKYLSVPTLRWIRAPELFYLIFLQKAKTD